MLMRGYLRELSKGSIEGAFPRLRTALLYGSGLAVGVFLLQWLEYQHWLRRFSTEFYLVFLSTTFTVFGIWIGHKLTQKPPTSQFTRNTQALRELAISDRESEVLTLLASGHNNQEIGQRLHISINTVKTHLQKVYAKLEVSHRGEAVQKARNLRLVP